MKAKFLVLAMLLLLAVCSGASALSYSVYLHSIDIQAANDGSATVVERFYLAFPTDADKVAFRDKSTELGYKIDQWTAFDKQFTPNIGLNNQSNGKIAYNEGTQNYLEISYGLTEPLMAQGKETTLTIDYSIKSNFLNSFYQSGIWVIPDNTKIDISLPPGAELKDTVEPEANIIPNGNRQIVSWTGYKSANKMTLDYVLWKKIAPVIEMGSIINWLFKTTEGLALIGIIIIIAGIIVWKRKTISSKVEGFVENNSILDEE